MLDFSTGNCTTASEVLGEAASLSVQFSDGQRALLDSRRSSSGKKRLRQDFRDNFPVDVGDAEITSLKAIGQTGVIQTKLIQDRRL